MTSNQEKFEQWLNAYLDDALTDEQRAKFEALIAKDPAARRQLELQQAVDASLQRSFDPPASQPTNIGDLEKQAQFRAGASSVTDKSSNQSVARTFRWQRYAMAALFALVAGGGAWWWSQDGGGGTTDPTYQYPTLLAFYDASAKNDFKEDWVCASPSEFAATFQTRVGYGLNQPNVPANVQLLGLKYGKTITGLTVHIMAKVDGEGVIVFVDKKSRDPKPDMKQGDLNVFRREMDHLIVFEMTPHDEPAILPKLEEREVSAEEVEAFYRR